MQIVNTRDKRLKAAGPQEREKSLNNLGSRAQSSWSNKTRSVTWTRIPRIIYSLVRWHTTKKLLFKISSLTTIPDLWLKRRSPQDFLDLIEHEGYSTFLIDIIFSDMNFTKPTLLLRHFSVKQRFWYWLCFRYWLEYFWTHQISSMSFRHFSPLPKLFCSGGFKK